MTETIRPPTNIKVCDAIMGSGKTSAAIRYMNEHPQERFIYVAPRLDDDRRIVAACPALNFEMPEKDQHNVKTPDFRRMLHAGTNVAITHALFEWCNGETADIIRENEYTMIVDEVVDIFLQSKLTGGDIDMLKSNGELIEDEDGWIERNPNASTIEHNEGLSNQLRYANSRSLVRVDQTSFCYWVVSDRLLTACKKVLIMTYLFEYSSMYQLLRLNDLPFDYIYVRKCDDGAFEFTNKRTYIPGYVGRLHEYINIVEDKRLNQVGEQRTALSANWYDKQCKAYLKLKERRKTDDSAKVKELWKRNEFKRLKANLRSFLTYVNADVPANDKLWTCFKDYAKHLVNHGFIDSFLYCTCSSTNDYGNRHYLAYLVNIFALPDWMKFYSQHGLDYNPDGYPLTVLLQWVWRSAIRNGEPITLYLPSSRMRKLLYAWIEECEEDYKNFYHFSEEENVA